MHRVTVYLYVVLCTIQPRTYYTPMARAAVHLIKVMVQQ